MDEGHIQVPVVLEARDDDSSLQDIRRFIFNLEHSRPFVFLPENAKMIVPVPCPSVALWNESLAAKVAESKNGILFGNEFLYSDFVKALKSASAKLVREKAAAPDYCQGLISRLEQCFESEFAELDENIQYLNRVTFLEGGTSYESAHPIIIGPVNLKEFEPKQMQSGYNESAWYFDAKMSLFGENRFGTKSLRFAQKIVRACLRIPTEWNGFGAALDAAKGFAWEQRIKLDEKKEGDGFGNYSLHYSQPQFYSGYDSLEELQKENNLPPKTQDMLKKFVNVADTICSVVNEAYQTELEEKRKITQGLYEKMNTMLK